VGEAKWTLSQSSLGWGFFPAYRADDGGADFFGINADYSANPPIFTVYGFDASGKQLSVESTSMPPAVADIYGGLIATYAYQPTIQRLGGSSSTPPWQYLAANNANVLSAPVQGPDGTVYFVEAVSRREEREGSDGFLVGLDGATGAVRFRTPISRVPYELKTDATCRRYGYPDLMSGSPSVSALTIGGDGALYGTIDLGHYRSTEVCDFPARWVYDPDHNPAWYTLPDTRIDFGAGSLDYLVDRRGIRIDQNGAVTMTPTLALASYVGPDTEGALNTVQLPVVGTLVSDLQHGVFAPVGYVDNLGNYSGFSLLRFTVNDVSFLPWPSQSPFNTAQLVTSSGTAYLVDPDSGLSAFDIESGQTLWTQTAFVTPVLETDRGTLVGIQYPSTFGPPSIVEIDRQGITLGTTPLTISFGDPILIGRGQGVLHGISDTGIVAIETPLFREAPSLLEVSLSGVIRNSKCETPPLDVDKGLVTRPEPYVYAFTGNTWSADNQLAVDTAFHNWNVANQSTTLATNFKRLTDEPSPDVFLVKTDLGTDNKGNPIIGFFPRPASNLVRDDDRIFGGNLYLTTNTNFLSEFVGYSKATMHEVGHSLGLAHLTAKQNGKRGSSIMNKFKIVEGGNLFDNRDDGGESETGNLPRDVTSCDAQQAYRRSQTP
jgi:outer membrane protein assembly factor BamB